MVLKLPPGDRRKVFEKKDFITFFACARHGAAVRGSVVRASGLVV